MSVIETERTGKLVDFYDEDSGFILEDGTGKEFDFARPGAQFDFGRDERVVFITITTPKGKVIVKTVIKGN
ncbi:MAG: hypothetical protein V4622_10805 [Bacteroidota bacterium]